MKNTRHQDLSRRPALMISRIVSRSLFDVPVNNIGQPFGARISSACSRPREPLALNHFLIRPERDEFRTTNQKPQG